MQTYIVHHDDADGRCAAAIAAKKSAEWMGDVVFLPARHGQPNEVEGWTETPANDCCLWVLDYAFDLATMRRLRALVRHDRFVWIDHHKTSIAALSEFVDEGFRGVASVEAAACLLTWWFCFGSLPAPEAVELIADRDMWAFRHGERTRHFNEVFGEKNVKADALEWERWLDPAYRLDPELKRGEILYRRRMDHLARALKRMGYSQPVPGTDLPAWNINYPACGELGELARGQGHSVLHAYHEEVRGGRLVRVHTLYSDQFDVGAIAVKNGGGGHAAAAGWVEEVRG